MEAINVCKTVIIGCFSVSFILLLIIRASTGRRV